VRIPRGRGREIDGEITSKHPFGFWENRSVALLAFLPEQDPTQGFDVLSFVPYVKSTILMGNSVGR
jgi:hypothetical protein